MQKRVIHVLAEGELRIKLLIGRRFFIIRDNIIYEFY